MKQQDELQCFAAHKVLHEHEDKEQIEFLKDWIANKEDNSFKNELTIKQSHTYATNNPSKTN